MPRTRVHLEVGRCAQLITAACSVHTGPAGTGRSQQKRPSKPDQRPNHHTQVLHRRPCQAFYIHCSCVHVPQRRYVCGKVYYCYMSCAPGPDALVHYCPSMYVAVAVIPVNGHVLVSHVHPYQMHNQYWHACMQVYGLTVSESMYVSACDRETDAYNCN